MRISKGSHVRTRGSSAKTDHARMLLQGIKKDAEQNRLTWADILLMKSMVKS